MASDAPLVSDRFPYLPISVEIAPGTRWSGEALLDTGFDGDVIIPASAGLDIVSDLLLPWQFADGSEVITPGCRGVLRLGAAEFQVVVALLGEEALIGISVIRQLVLTLERGQRVLVQI